MANNLYFRYIHGKWFGFKELLPKAVLDSSNARIYLGKINWPHSKGNGTAEFNIDGYQILDQGLSPSRIKLPKDYKTRRVGNTDMFNGERGELAASLVFDDIKNLISQAERIAHHYPHSLCYLLDFDESKRELTLFPNLILFHKRFRES